MRIHSHPATQPVPAWIVLTDPDLYADLCTREELRPRTRETRKVAFGPLADHADHEEHPIPLDLPPTNQIPTLSSAFNPPNQTPNTPLSVLLPPIQLISREISVSKTRRGIIPGVCPDASPITPESSASTDSDIAHNIENFNPFLRKSTAEKTPLTTHQALRYENSKLRRKFAFTLPQTTAE